MAGQALTSPSADAKKAVRLMGGVGLFKGTYMRSFRVSFHADEISPLAEFVVEANLDGEAIEEATRLFHAQHP